MIHEDSPLQSEDTLTALVSNSAGNGVTQGTKVVFIDSLATGQTGVGQFRAVNNSTNSQSTTSAIYAVGNLPVGTKIYIKATVQGTGIQDIVQLTVTQ